MTATNRQVECLETHIQQFRRKAGDRMFTSRSMIKSPAFWALRTATACKVLFAFLNKQCWEKIQGARARRKNDYVCSNNGEIQFSYQEAVSKWHITRPAFCRAIDELIDKGFVDITHTGSGLQKGVSLYAISERWRNYGTTDFIAAQRPKRKQHYGFAKGHKYKR